jgi:hypothetical protein
MGHLNHLSTSLLGEAARRRSRSSTRCTTTGSCAPRPVHADVPEEPGIIWPACDGQDDRSAPSGATPATSAERPTSASVTSRTGPTGSADAWRTCERWSIASTSSSRPARYLLSATARNSGSREQARLPRLRLRPHAPGGRRRRRNEPFTFGYIGTHIPAKGIHVSCSRPSAASRGTRDCGSGAARAARRPRPCARSPSALPGAAPPRIEWLPEYRNQEIVTTSSTDVDAIVVPSIWVENSPLVIHEAQQARVPVITADAGGMAEYVRHEVNGLLFTHRDPVVARRADDAPRGRSGARASPRRARIPRLPSGDVPSVRRPRAGHRGAVFNRSFGAATPPAWSTARGPGASPSTPTRTRATYAA